jgi:hypothetical protein
MKANVVVDSKRLNGLLNALSGKQMKQAINATLRSSARILQKETDKQFKQNIPGLKVRKDSKKSDGKSVWKRIAEIRVHSKEQYAEVHIRGDFRARFFEGGTKPRYTKSHRLTGEYYTRRDGGRKYRGRTGKGGYRGKIEAGHHFETAQRLTEHYIFQNMNAEMTKQIMRIAKKYNAV